MQIFTYENTRTRTRGNRFRQFPSVAKGRTRLFPYARPNFEGKHLGLDSNFFVLGACFSRSIERALSAAGRNVLSSPTDVGLPGTTAEQFQRYNIFNLDVALNELSWALTTTSSGAEVALLPLGDQLADTQLNWTFARDPETAKDFRNIYNKSYASIVDADAVIIATGGIEQWYDTHKKIYINSMPGPTSDNLYPGRFELHRIDAEEAESTLRKIVDLIRAHSKRDPIFHIGVSPVSQPMIFGPDDILVDQFYAKVVQREAVERLISSDDKCIYMPSLETAMWSDFQYNYLETSMNHTNANFASRMVSDLLEASGANDRRFKEFRALAHGVPMAEGGNTSGAISLCEEVIQEGPVGDGEVDSFYIRALVKAHRPDEALSHIFKRLRSGELISLMFSEIVRLGHGVISQDQKNEAINLALHYDVPSERLSTLKVFQPADPTFEARGKLAVIARTISAGDFNTASMLAEAMLPEQSILGPRDRARLYQMLIRCLLSTEKGSRALELSLHIMRSDLRHEPIAFGAAERGLRLHGNAGQLHDVLIELRQEFSAERLTNLERNLVRMQRRIS